MRDIRQFPITREEKDAALNKAMEHALRSTDIGDITPAAIASIRRELIAKGEQNIEDIIVPAVRIFMDQALGRFKTYESRDKAHGAELQEAIALDYKIVAALRKELNRF